MEKRFDIYSAVTQKVLDSLAAGTVPWQKPWRSDLGGYPTNLVSKRPYSGINLILLGMTPYSSPYWGSFKQVQALGGSVKQGEKGTMVLFWKILENLDRKTGEVKKVPLLRYFTVFNCAEQCEGLETKIPSQCASIPFDPIEEAENLILGYQDCPTIEHRGNRAVYLPQIDTVRMPKKETFVSKDFYYATLLHECVHSTGGNLRLNRTELIKYGETHNQSVEELTAEIGSSMLCSMVGIDSTFGNSISYIKSWISSLQNDPKMIIHASAKAQKACEWILGNRSEQQAQTQEVGYSLAA